MNELVELWERPEAAEKYMIAGWRQWADAGSISSGLPAYLVELTDAQKIGEIKPDGFYLFQIPGTHHFIRPTVRLVDGHRESLEEQKNEIFYAEVNGKGLFIFLGDEPHLSVNRYAGAFLDAAEALGIQKIAVVGGVYGEMPYDKERDISCVYSLPEMRADLDAYAVRFSNYEGGSTIGTFLADRAEKRGVAFFVFYAFVPSYELSQDDEPVQGIRIERDFKAWYDLLRRLDYMFDLALDMSHLKQQSRELKLAVQAKIEELDSALPDLGVKEYFRALAESYTERTFSPLSDLWTEALGDILDEIED